MLKHRKVKKFRHFSFIFEQKNSFVLPGNLFLLPSHLSTFGVRSADQKFNGEFNHAVDQQRAIKQLEISSQIQTSLELKIDALKKEIRQ